MLKKHKIEDCNTYLNFSRLFGPFCKVETALFTYLTKKNIVDAKKESDDHIMITLKTTTE